MKINKKQIKFNNQKGITLVALVVTIVVLLILAGITITTLFSDNGIIARAREAKTATEQDAVNTEQGLQNLIGQMDSILGYTASSVKANASDFYGKPIINYSAKEGTAAASAVSKWDIFYSDGSNIYLIADDYVPVSALPQPINAEGTKGTAPANTSTNYPLAASFNNIISSYEGSNRITDTKLQNLNKSYFDYLSKNSTTSTNSNMKSVAYMMDTTAWSDYAGDKADFAIGGPTLEMLLNSYSEYYANDETIQGIKDGKYKYQAKVTETNPLNGYQLSYDYGATWKNWTDTSTAYLEHSSDNMYVKTNYTNRATAYWVSSPSASDTSVVVYVYCGGNVYDYDYSNDYFGFRPVVSLKSNIQLEAVKENGEITGYKIK